MTTRTWIFSSHQPWGLWGGLVFSQMVANYHRSLGSTDSFFWLPVGVHQFPSISESIPTTTHTGPFRSLSSEVPRGRHSCSTTQGSHFSPSSLIKPRILVSYIPGSKENGWLVHNHQPSPTQYIYSVKIFSFSRHSTRVGGPPPWTWKMLTSVFQFTEITRNFYSPFIKALRSNFGACHSACPQLLESSPE